MTILQKTKLTNRKFYNKWLYKVSLKINGIGILRSRDLDSIKEFCERGSPDDRPYSISSKAYANRDIIFQLAFLLDSFDKNLWSKRIENSNIDIYTNDRGVYDAVSNEFEDQLYHRFEPDEHTIDALANSHTTIVAKKLPHGRYNYKVYLLPHKMAGDREGKQQYINWIKKHSPKITCTEAVQSWFVKTDWNWDRRYVLVEDESMLLMLKLKNSEVVGRIYNYQLCDK